MTTLGAILLAWVAASAAVAWGWWRFFRDIRDFEDRRLRDYLDRL